MDDVRCTGTESTLTSCAHTTNHNCVHSEDAGVRCTSISNSKYTATSHSAYQRSLQSNDNDNLSIYS